MNLGHPDRRHRLDLVAAEYVLGTLPLRARARLSRAALADASVAQAISEWERRLCGLADGVPGVAPPPQVWDAIARRLRFIDTRADAGWWGRVALWRVLAIASFAGFLALGVGTLVERSEVQRNEVPGTIVVVLASTGGDAKPALLATAARGERVLHVKAIGSISVPADRALELWMLPTSGDPKSMGLVNASGSVALPLATASGDFLANAKGLAITLEPAGGSPSGKPTGPILYSGAIETI
ncbi:MAG: anti-sigma factor [Casimicrobiaceae bacterium]